MTQVRNKGSLDQINGIDLEKYRKVWLLFGDFSIGFDNEFDVWNKEKLSGM